MGTLFKATKPLLERQLIKKGHAVVEMMYSNLFSFPIFPREYVQTWCKL